MDKAILDAYLAVGAGGICLLLMVWIIVFQQKSIIPKLEKMESDNNVTNEILRSTNDVLNKSVDIIAKNQDVIEGNQKSIENNTEAIKNFSNVLQDFSASMAIYNEKFRSIEKQMEETAEKVTVMNERLIK